MIYHILGVSTPTGARCNEKPRGPHWLSMALGPNSSDRLINPRASNGKYLGFVLPLKLFKLKLIFYSLLHSCRSCRLLKCR